VVLLSGMATGQEPNSSAMTPAAILVLATMEDPISKRAPGAQMSSDGVFFVPVDVGNGQDVLVNSCLQVGGPSSGKLASARAGGPLQSGPRRPVSCRRCEPCDNAARAGGATAAAAAVTTTSHHQACDHFAIAAAPPAMITPAAANVTGQRSQRDRSPGPLTGPPC